MILIKVLLIFLFIHLNKHKVSSSEETNNNSFWESHELIPTLPPESLEAIPKCGEGIQENKFTCVPYYNCDFATNTVKEVPEVDGSGKIEPRAHQLFDPSCNDFFHVCCQISNSTTPSNNSLPVEELSESEEHLWKNCGEFNPVKSLKQPWLVLIILANDSYFRKICKGSLISPRVVLTAAHCVKGLNNNEIRVRSKEKNYQEIEVETALIHEQFMNTTLYNDGALLVLKKSFKKRDEISTICLPQSSDKFNQSSCRMYNSDLVQLISRRDCQKQLRNSMLGDKFVLESSFLCANKSLTFNSTLIHKKSKTSGGSSLVCPSLGKPVEKYLQVGISSWSVSTSGNNLQVFSNVVNLRYWIDGKISLMGLHKIDYTPHMK